MNNDFWRDKRVLITGHTGFKGSWLSLWLQSLGADVCGLSLLPKTNPNMFNLANVSSGMKSFICDIRDLKCVRNIVKESQPEIVFHLAAQSLVIDSYLDPIDTYSTNIFGAICIYESIRKDCSKAIIISVTSDKCYEINENLSSFNEEAQLGGFDPYSSSKACVELISSTYRRSFFDEVGIGLATARSGNVIGGGDWSKDRLVPDILKSLEGRNPIIIRNPSYIRPWQHVLEPLSGYLLLAEKLYYERSKYSQPWNFGPIENDAKTVSWLVDKFVELWSVELPSIRKNQLNFHESQAFKLDISKSKQILNWEPRWDIIKSINMTIAWHKIYLNKGNMRETSLSQIKEYESSKS